MLDRELIIKAIKDLSKECSTHRDCTTCIFYDGEDESDSCEIKNTQETPSEWYIG